MIRDNVAYQLFCGYDIVDSFKVPDHSKIEEFRSRLLPETQRSLANLIVKEASGLGYANPKELDIDSTPQNANISYPSKAGMLLKIARLAKKFAKPLNALCKKGEAVKSLSISSLNQLSLYYYALKRKGNRGVAQKMLKRLWTDTYSIVLPVLKDSYQLF